MKFGKFVLTAGKHTIVDYTGTLVLTAVSLNNFKPSNFNVGRFFNNN